MALFSRRWQWDVLFVVLCKVVVDGTFIPIDHFFVVSSTTSSRFESTYYVDVQLHWYDYKSNCSVSCKAMFGRGGAPSCVG